MPRRVVRVAPAVAEAEAATLRRGLARLREELGLPGGFPPAVLAEATRSVERVRLPALDRTEIPFVTIDPEGARDLDQALHLERRGGGFRVHYAIADVAAFVRPGGAVDEEAHARGETVYGAGGKVPLHPPVLSEHAASLLPDGPRPALLWTLDLASDGEVTGARVERALVRSRAQLTYAGVQRDLDRGTAGEMLGLLPEVGRLRLEQEAARGGVSLPLPDQEVTCEDGRWRLTFRQPLPVEQWNAQISLMTGMAAARLMVEAGTGLLRTLAPARPDDLARLRRVARALAVAWADDVSYPDLIRRLDPSRADHAALLVEATTLLRGSAYLPFTGGAPEQGEHSAIAATYAHVTAPLRRLVDRYAGEICLAHCAGAPVPGWVLERLDALPATMQASTRRANQYERGMLDLLEAVLLQHRVGDTFPAMVIDVRDKEPARGQVMVSDPAVEAPARSADGGALPLGTSVTARLVCADPDQRAVLFEV